MNLAINIQRLQRDLEELGRIGSDLKGGVSRPSFSQADLEARAWLKKRLHEASLEIREDGAGNIFGRLRGKLEEPVILVGSHLDTVINGGRFDGTCGVVSALECLRTIQEKGIVPYYPLEVVAFTDEEGNIIGDFLGSRAFTGTLNEEILRRGQTNFGQPLQNILEGTGISLESILRAKNEAPKVLAYLELHIEQGELLDLEAVPIGLVTKITGKRLYQATFSGQVSHAGTTPMELRRDAFIGLAELAVRATRLVAAEDEDGRLTIGRVQLHPGSFSSIPGQADFTLDLRHPERENLIDLEKKIIGLAQEIAITRGLSFYYQLVDSTEPTPMSSRLLALLEEEVRNLNYPYLKLISGAGHDAQILAKITEAAMIFIPSINGLSHSPEEAIRWEDLEKGANLLLQVLVRLATSF
ncbi:MAG: Zn-dependent hydrolase [Candidatus Aminicenantes bacterium]|nr:Zn-dependent hydrolase [Candidatus Aminicenantes bacterium]